MNDHPSPPSLPNAPAQAPVVVNLPPPPRRRWWPRLLLVALVVSVMFNLALFSGSQAYYADAAAPREQFHSGEQFAADKIVLLNVQGTIMPPFTKRILNAIDAAKKDEAVKGLVLAVDSPGGLVPDSHQIYNRLKEFSEQKPIVVAMQRMAASGGYYIAMGGGESCRIFAEPTTWTGSIGVIIPRFDATALAEKVGLASDPLKTGPFKDALSPFREVTDEERAVWTEILDDAFDRFIDVIAENRSELDHDAAKALATGQIYTAEQAHENGLVDEIGYVPEAIEFLQKELGLDKARIVKYQFPVSLMDLVAGSIESQQPASQWRDILEATVPQAMYLCSWAPAIPNR